MLAFTQTILKNTVAPDITYIESQKKTVKNPNANELSNNMQQIPTNSNNFLIFATTKHQINEKAIHHCIMHHYDGNHSPIAKHKPQRRH